MQKQTFHIETFNHIGGRWEHAEDVAGVQPGLARLDVFDRDNTCAALIRVRDGGERMALAFNREAKVWGKHSLIASA